MAALFGADAAVRARSIHKAEHGAVEFFRLLHQAHRLAVAFGIGAAEVVFEARGGIFALFDADDGDRAAADGSHAADDGTVVCKAAVAVQLDKPFYDVGNIPDLAPIIVTLACTAKGTTKLYNASNKYILIAEYYNQTPIMIDYRGNKDRLFKRDFAGEILDKYPDLKLIDYGFFYNRDSNFKVDDINWFLMEK